jgi:hypothetical protein
MISHTVINVAVDLLSMPNLYRSSLLQESGKVISIYHPEIMNKLDQDIYQAIFRLENKIKMLSRTEKEIFKDHNLASGLK